MISFLTGTASTSARTCSMVERSLNTGIRTDRQTLSGSRHTVGSRRVLGCDSSIPLRIIETLAREKESRAVIRLRLLGSLRRMNLLSACVNGSHGLSVAAHCRVDLVTQD